MLQYALHGLGVAAVTLATGYALIACFAERSCRLHTARRSTPAPRATTILKPLCGDEPDLYRCLRSFCVQDHPRYEVIFGVLDASDPALSTVHKLQCELPDVDIVVVVDSRLHGSNRKVSNLINMMRVARYDTLVLADSDVIVGADYLQRVTAALADNAVGLTTCIYRARPVGRIWSDLAAHFVNEWFIPAVKVSRLFGGSAFSSGASIALRRDTLARLGGFEAIADLLADDYWLGELTRRQGLRTVLADVVVDIVVAEPGLAAACRHELRWLRTIRSVQPGGYAFLGVTFSAPVIALGTLMAGGGSFVLIVAAAGIVARILLHYYTRNDARNDGGRSAGRTVSASPVRAAPLWLVPFGDLLAFALWCWSFSSRRVHWREAVFAVARDGSARRTA